MYKKLFRWHEVTGLLFLALCAVGVGYFLVLYVDEHVASPGWAFFSLGVVVPSLFAVLMLISQLDDVEKAQALQLISDKVLASDEVCYLDKAVAVRKKFARSIKLQLEEAEKFRISSPRDHRFVEQRAQDLAGRGRVIKEYEEDWRKFAEALKLIHGVDVPDSFWDDLQDFQKKEGPPY